MEVVGWSPLEKRQDPDASQLPPQVEGWTGGGEPRCVLTNPSNREPLIHNPLPPPPVCTPAFRLLHSQSPHLLASSLLPPTNVVSKIRSMSLVLVTRSSSSAAITPKSISPAVARSVPLKLRRPLYPRGPEMRGRTRSPRPNGITGG